VKYRGEKQLHKYDNDEIIEHKLTSIFISARDDDRQEMISKMTLLSIDLQNRGGTT
jgi:hypothetical protein